MKRIRHYRKNKMNNLTIYSNQLFNKGTKRQAIFTGRFESIKAMVEYCCLFDIDLTNADLSWQDLTDIDLCSCDFRYCNFAFADFTDTNMCDCRFDHSILDGVTLPSEEYMEGVDFSRVDNSAHFADEYASIKMYK